MIWILLFLAIFRPLPLSAQTISPAPTSLSANLSLSTVSVGTSFQLNYTINNPRINTDYYVKAFGGINGSNSYLQTYNNTNWLNYTGDSWSNFPSITTSDTSSFNGSVFARVKPDSSDGSYNVYLKVCLKNDTDTCTTTSSPLTLLVQPAPSITSPPPSTTPIPTTIPNSSPSVSITTSNSNLKIGQEYTLNFNISNPISGHNYYLKVFGGTNNSGIETSNGTDWLSYTSSWSSFPQYPAKTSLNFRFKSDESLGPKNIYLRIKDVTSNADYESQSIPINLSAADPTATSTPKVTPSPSITPWPSEALAKEAQPTAVLEPLPTDGLFLEPTLPSGLVAGLSTSSDITISPTPKPQKSLGNDIIPIALVTVGGLFLTAPLIISKIKPV